MYLPAGPAKPVTGTFQMIWEMISPCSWQDDNEYRRHIHHSQYCLCLMWWPNIWENCRLRQRDDHAWCASWQHSICCTAWPVMMCKPYCMLVQFLWIHTKADKFAWVLLVCIAIAVSSSISLTITKSPSDTLRILYVTCPKVSVCGKAVQQTVCSKSMRSNSHRAQQYVQDAHQRILWTDPRHKPTFAARFSCPW